MMRRFSAMWVTGILSVALLSAALACGGGDDGTPTAPAAQTTPTQTGSTAQPTSTTQAVASTQPTTEPATQTGHLIISIPRIDPNFLHSSPFAGFNSDHIAADPLVFADPAPIPQRGTFNPDISIVTSWEVAPDSRSVTFTVRPGVKYHHGFGEVTPSDIAWSFNDALREGNTNPRSGFVGEYQGNWEATGDDTVVMHVKDSATLSPVWLLELSNTWRNTLTVTSPQAAEQYGPGSNMVIGTGPFQMISAAPDDRAEYEAVPEHYRSVPKIARLTELVIPEISTRVAAFKAGEFHIGNIPAQFIREAVEAREGRIELLGEGLSLHIFMSGNHWQTSDPLTNEDIPARAGFKPDDAHPWISDPDDPASMERGDKFRRALALALDRDSINRVVGNELTPAHYTFTGFIEADAAWKDAWHIPYDVDAARALLGEIGITEGFALPVWIAPDDAALPPEIADAAVQMWQNIGFDVQVEKTVYAARRPSVVDRAIDIPMYHHMNIGFPDEPKGRLITAAQGGANRGMELPNDLLERTYWANLVEQDASARIANNVVLQDFLTEHMLAVPIVRYNQPIAVAPEVLEWRPYTETFGGINAFDTVVMQ